MGACTAKHKNIKVFKSNFARAIICTIEIGEEIVKTSFHSGSTISEVKHNLKKLIFKTNADKKIITLYYNGKELKQENEKIGNLCNEDEMNLVMASVTLNDEITTDPKKFDEILISKLSRNCNVHKSLKAMTVCISCYISLCEKCKTDHNGHQLINRGEMIKYEASLREIKENLSQMFKTLEIDTAQNEVFTKTFHKELTGSCDDLVDLVIMIKKHEDKLTNEFKTKFDSIFPSVMEYYERVNNLIEQVSESKKEKIIRNDSDYVEFYQRYVNIQKHAKKANENMHALVRVINTYKEQFTEIKRRVQLIIDFIHDQCNQMESNNNIINRTDEEEVVFNNANDTKLNNNENNYAQCRSSRTDFMHASSNHNGWNPNHMQMHENRSCNEIGVFNSSCATRNFSQSGKLNLLSLMTPSKSNNNLIKSMEKKIQHKKSAKDNPEIVEEQKESLELIHSHSLVNDSLLNIEVSTSNVYVYDPKGKLLIKKELDLSKTQIKKFEAYHSTLNHQGKFFISGGFSTSKMFYQYTLFNNAFLKLQDMPTGHSYHCLLGVNGYIFAISGFHTQKVERYLIETNAWTPLPDLAIARSWPSCICIDDQFIFLFAGLSDKPHCISKLIEKLNIRQLSRKWEHIEILTSDKAMQIPLYCGIFRSCKEKIILVGGKNDSKEDNINKCYSYSIEDNKFELIEDMKLPFNDEFDGKLFLCVDTEGIVGQFSAVVPSRFYQFEKKSKKFEIIEHKIKEL